MHVFNVILSQHSKIQPNMLPKTDNMYILGTVSIEKNEEKT